MEENIYTVEPMKSLEILYNYHVKMMKMNEFGSTRFADESTVKIYNFHKKKAEQYKNLIEFINNFTIY